MVMLRITYNDGSTTTVSGSVEWIDRCIFNMPFEDTQRIVDFKFSDGLK